MVRCWTIGKLTEGDHRDEFAEFISESCSGRCYKKTDDVIVWKEAKVLEICVRVYLEMEY